MIEEQKIVSPSQPEKEQQEEQEEEEEDDYSDDVFQTSDASLKFELDKDEPVKEQKAEMQSFKPAAPKPLENKPKVSNIANVEKK